MTPEQFSQLKVGDTVELKFPIRAFWLILDVGQITTFQCIWSDLESLVGQTTSCETKQLVDLRDYTLV